MTRSANELDVEIVRHGSAPLSDWADRAEPGLGVAMSGPGRGYLVDPHAPAFLIAGDESALPAITTLIPALPSRASGACGGRSGRPDRRGWRCPVHPRLTEEWCRDRCCDAISRVARLAPDTRVWVAGQAAAVQRIRKHLFDEQSVPREHAVVRGYWKT